MGGKPKIDALRGILTALQTSAFYQVSKRTFWWRNGEDLTPFPCQALRKFPAGPDSRCARGRSRRDSAPALRRGAEGRGLAARALPPGVASEPSGARPLPTPLHTPVSSRSGAAASLRPLPGGASGRGGPPGEARREGGWAPGLPRERRLGPARPRPSPPLSQSPPRLPLPEPGGAAARSAAAPCAASPR